MPSPLATATRTRTPTPGAVTPVPTRRPPTSTAQPTVRRTVAPTRTPPLSSANRTRIQLAKFGNQWAFSVNGKPIYIKGMNYNVNYTELNEETQWKLHRRDFKIMRDAGINVIVGWGIYDDVTLRVAEEFGIGVIMPFDLPANGDYDNENYRNEVKSNFTSYVTHYRNYPAVWGWNPGGDELLYRMRTEENRTPDKLQAAADLELELATLAYTLDSVHFSLIKEPRDWYLKYLVQSFNQAKGKPGYQDPKKFLMYGVNVYGQLDDINTVLRNTRNSIDTYLGIPMIVSEFGPFQRPRESRPEDYAAIWDIAFQISGIGACVYVFGPDQPNPQAPNPYDPLVLLPSEYSLLDIDAKPIDNAFAALSVKWLSTTAPTPFPTPTATLPK
jgi:hypothetical protein